MENASRLGDEKITGVILAGGRGSRMGGLDKGLVNYQGEPLYKKVLKRLQPQVDQVIISANRNIACYQESGLRVLTDILPDYPGPLAGMLTVLESLEDGWVMFVSCDTPNIPLTLVSHLRNNRGDSPVVWVKTLERDHPTLALMHTNLKKELYGFLSQGERRVMQFMRQAGGRAVPCGDGEEAFLNVNYLPD